MLELSVNERFDAKVDRSNPDGCWEWTGALNFPHRIPARRIAEAEAAGVRLELIAQFGTLLTEFARQKRAARIGAIQGSKPDPDPSAPALVKAA